MADPQSTSEEVWLSVVGDEGYYEVSSLGRVRSLRFRNGHSDLLRPEPKLKPLSRMHGYLAVGIRHRMKSVHALVLEAFVGPRPAGANAAHLDGNRENNTLDNLAWVSPTENARHKLTHGRAPIGERHAQCRLTDVDVATIRAEHDGHNTRALADRFGVHTASILKIVQYKHRKNATPVNPLQAEVEHLRAEANDLQAQIAALMALRDEAYDEIVSQSQQIAALMAELDAARSDVVLMAQTKLGEKCEHHRQSLAVLEYIALRECPVCWMAVAKEAEARVSALQAALKQLPQYTHTGYEQNMRALSFGATAPFDDDLWVKASDLRALLPSPLLPQPGDPFTADRVEPIYHAPPDRNGE